MTKITTAMVLAAGLGKRMLPLTKKMPKPLIEVAGKPLLAWALDHLRAAGVTDVVVNAHYKADQIEAFLQKQKDLNIHYIYEPAVLETGGALKNAMEIYPDLFKKPFYVFNSDCVWLNGTRPFLKQMAAFWDSKKMDFLLLVNQTSFSVGADLDQGNHAGDFIMDQFNRLTPRGERQVAPFMYTGVQIVAPKIFKGVALEKFSIRRLWAGSQEAARFLGLLHDGHWYTVGTPEQLALTEKKLKYVLTDY